MGSLSRIASEFAQSCSSFQVDHQARITYITDRFNNTETRQIHTKTRDLSEQSMFRLDGILNFDLKGTHMDYLYADHMILKTFNPQPQGLEPGRCFK